ncbi:hypothetical protein [Psittacicella hinzii]|nr:hypothetical protein [Psittacicella hinzii]
MLNDVIHDYLTKFTDQDLQKIAEVTDLKAATSGNLALRTKEYSSTGFATDLNKLACLVTTPSTAFTAKNLLEILKETSKEDLAKYKAIIAGQYTYSLQNDFLYTELFPVQSYELMPANLGLDQEAEDKNVLRYNLVTYSDKLHYLEDKIEEFNQVLQTSLLGGLDEVHKANAFASELAIGKGQSGSSLVVYNFTDEQIEKDWEQRLYSGTTERTFTEDYNLSLEVEDYEEDFFNLWQNKNTYSKIQVALPRIPVPVVTKIYNFYEILNHHLAKEKLYPRERYAQAFREHVGMISVNNLLEQKENSKYSFVATEAVRATDYMQLFILNK